MQRILRLDVIEFILESARNSKIMKKVFPEIIFKFARVVPGLALFALTKEANSNPVGLTVQSGSATISVNGSQFTINAGNNAHLGWQHFNIGSGETTIFNQPS